ncbi:MAG: beta-propeller fold lactonase family protein [Saprospiraceae bacterium]|nr:beta-propeller fold lactonase family protein [Saprospiraceae bacterium]
MKYPTTTHFVLSTLILFTLTRALAQCPQVEAIMVDACFTEHLNEFIIIHSGGGFNTADIQLDFDQSNNILGSGNNDINTNNNNDPGDPTPCGLIPGNINAFTGCSNLIAVGPGVDIPPNSIVVLQTSNNSVNNQYNFSTLCGAGQCVYVISSACTRTAGGFTNGGTGTRTTVFSIAGTCIQSMTYDRALLSGNNGDYYLPLTNTYGNAGCVVPPTSPATQPPNLNPIPNVSQCGSYTLPAITGTNLSGNAAYFTGPNGTGTQYNPGDIITTTTTLYAYDAATTAGCSDQEQFTVTITAGPTVNLPADVVACSGQALNIPITGSAGATFPWTNDNTAIGLGASGTGTINFTAANVVAQQIAQITITPTQAGCTSTPVSFTITVNPGTSMDDPPNQTVCAGTQVDVVFTSSNNPTFNWTNNNTVIGLGPNGNGNISFTSANVATTQTATITVTPSENGCTGPAQTFTITVNPSPTANTPANATACGGQAVNINLTGSAGATLNWTNSNPAIGLGASGTGNISFTSAAVTAQEVATITVTPVQGSCTGNPINFTITINPSPVMDDPMDQTVCAGTAVSVMFNSPGFNPNFSWTNSNPAIGLSGGGFGNINFTAANVATPQTGTITVTPAQNGCTGAAQTFTITVNPTPTVTQPAPVTTCGGQAVAVNFTGNPPGTTFNWTNSNTAIGLTASGSGNLNFTAASVTNTETATITVTPQIGSCVGNAVSFTITINPGLTVDPPGNQTVCGGEAVSVIFSGSGSNPTYNWTNSNTAIGLAGSGSGNINFTSANVAGVQTGTIMVTATANGCTSPPQQFTITVNPTPSVNQPANNTSCGGQAVNINLAGTAGATFNWTNDNPAIGLAASGAGSINFTASNPATPQTANITVTPTIGTCMGTAVSFTITINPTPVLNPPANQSVCAGDNVAVSFTGSGASPTYNWTNSNPAIGLPASGSGDINFTAANVNAVQTGTITVTPTENGCAGAAQTFTVTVTPVPLVTQPIDVNACGGGQINVAFAGTPGATFNWTNDNTAIGLAASGSGTISFTAAAVVVPELANITVTPVIGPCAGMPRTFTITINPTPTVNDPQDLIVCGGDVVNVNFTGTDLPTFNWTNTNVAIGLPTASSGSIAYTAPLVTSQQTGTITVTPIENGCVGASQTFTITVSPAPTVNQPANISICSGQSILINLSGTNGATFNWTNDNPAIGLPINGVGNIDLTAANVTSTQTGTVTITPTIGSCDGAPVSFTITINPAPTVVDPADQTVCAGDPVDVSFSGTGNPAFNWTNNNPAIGLAASGTGNISFPASNVGSAQTATITVTPVLGNCSGAAQTFTITVNPAPTVDQPGNVNVCNGEPVMVNFTGTGNPTFNWTNDNPAIGLAASGTGNLDFTSAQVTATETATITVTPTGGVCPGIPATFTISVSPGVSVNNPGNQAVCVGDSIHVLFTGTGNPTFSWTNDNPAIGLAASGTGDIHILSANVTMPETATITVTPEGGFGGYAYITHFGSDQVSVIEIATNTVVATIPVGNVPQGVSVSPNGTRVYISNTFDDNVSVIDATTNTVIATVPVGNSPLGLAVSPDGSRVYVTNWLGASVSVIDAATNTVAATIPGLSQPRGIGVSPDGSRVYVAEFGFARLAVIDAGTNTILSTVPLGTNGPQDLEVSPDGSRIYISNEFSDDLSVVDAVALNVFATIPVGAGPMGICVSPDGSLVYVSNQNSDDVSVIDATTNMVINTIGIGNSPRGISITPDGNWVYVANFISGDVTVIETATGMVVATVPTASSPVAFGNFISPVLSTCTGAPQTFTITVSPAPTLAQPNDFTFCGNTTSMVGFNASAGATVNWTNDNPAIGLAASGTGTINFIAANVATPQTATITATPVVGSCSGTPMSFTITINPAVMGGVTGDLLICEGDSTILTATGGVLYEWDNGDTTATITVSPTVPTTYVAIITNSFGCFRAASALVDVDQAPVATISGNTDLCAGQGTTLTASGGGSYVWSNSDNAATVNVSPANTTSYTVTVTNAFSCTATSEITVTVNQPDTLNLMETSCNPADTGTVVQNWQNQFGCDSIVTTITTLAPSNTVDLTEFTCDQTQAGVFVQNLMNQFGCDSIVTTTVIYDPAAVDTTLLNFTTCDANQAGVQEMVYPGSDGCDSLVIMITSFVPADTVYLTGSTCDPNMVGTTELLLMNQAGCDSLIITTTSFSLADTVYQTASTCDPNMAGTTELLLMNQAGCDSLIITTTSLLLADTVYQTVLTCDSMSAGVFTQSWTNQAGCDSTTITTVTFDPSLINITFLSGFTCDPDSAGTTQISYTGSDGCDSIVVTTLALSASDTLTVSSFTCDPTQAGTFVNVLQNQAGCDSVLISEVLYDAAACGPVLTVIGTNLNCADGSDGIFSIQILSGQTPLQYDWENNLGNSGTGQITDPNNPTLLQNLPAGNYTITVTDLNNQATTTATVTLTAPPAISLAANPVLAFNGFALSCNNSADGAITSTTSGGTPPYQFSWSNSTINPDLNNLSAGTYTLTLTDANGCTSTTSALVTAPPPLNFALALDLLDCGDTLADATISTAGGVSPYTLLLDGNILTGTMPSISSGSHTISLTDANGCTVDSTITVTLPPSPTIALPADTTVLLGNPLQLEATTNLSNWASLTWQPLPDTSCANCLVQNWAPRESEFITVTIVDTFGCTAQATIRVSVDKSLALYVPNVFSPNNDGINDLWVVNAGASVLEITDVQVFDRWGNLQYQWNNAIDPNAWPGWDGTTRGKKAQLGVYVYYLKVKLADGSEEVVKGDVTVMGW